MFAKLTARSGDICCALDKVTLAVFSWRFCCLLNLELPLSRLIVKASLTTGGKVQTFEAVNVSLIVTILI